MIQLENQRQSQTCKMEMACTETIKDRVGMLYCIDNQAGYMLSWETVLGDIDDNNNGLILTGSHYIVED